MTEHAKLLIWTVLPFLVFLLITLGLVVSREKGQRTSFSGLAARVLDQKGRFAGRIFQGHRPSLLEENMKQNLFILYPGRSRQDERELLHTCQVTRLKNTLLVLYFGSLLALLAALSAWSCVGDFDGSHLTRPGYLDRERQVELVEKTYGHFSLDLQPRTYGEDVLAAMADIVEDALPQLILGDNPDLEHVRSRLNLMKELENAPFRISWKSSDEQVLTTSGIVHGDLLPESGQENLILMASLSAQGEHFETSIPVTVLAPILTREEKEREDIQLKLQEEEEKARGEREVDLPLEMHGKSLSWEDPVPDTAVELLIMTVLAGGLIYFAPVLTLGQQVRTRQRQLLVDYPCIVSRMVLYLGAGLSLRGIFKRLGEEYETRRRKGGEKRYAYEEILLAIREMDSGTAQEDAYIHYGQRCGNRHYARLSGLLVQNLSKGNTALTRALSEEAASAQTERRNMARVLGEEAGTRLLFPMMIMLAVTLVIIMVPAYLGFM